MFNVFIHRPVLSLVISLLITLLGLLALTQLPVTQFPDIVPPSVSVTTSYTGANAEVSAKAVVTTLERAINGVPGMTYMTSVSGNDGTSIITVNFNVGVDPDIAAVNVQNRVSTVLDELPEEVIKAGVGVEKEVNSMLLYLNILSSDQDADEKFIYNFADINILPELKRIDGVGYATIMGAREYSMRVWLKPDRMAFYDISTDEVIQAIRNQNVEAAPGKTGESSDRNSQVLQYVLRYTGKFNEPQQYENIVLRADKDGSLLKLKDIATIEFGSRNYSVLSKENGKPSAAIMLKQRPGSNAKEVIENVKKRMEELKVIAFPPGMGYTIGYDVSRFLDASIDEVLRTLIEAFILVSLVVFLFLQDFRSTLIPALAVPVSLIGTFFFMQMLGFSINLLTLFALVLAIGIVVDNAIVVVEAVHVKMGLGLSPRQATLSAMNEISGALIGITLVMSAVFVPVAFMSGPVGIFYRQFSLTLAISIVISGINAVSLTPALCAILLKDTHHAPKKDTWLQRFFNRFNQWYESVSEKYQFFISKTAARRTVTLALFVGFIMATWGMSNILPTGFIPSEDQGMIYANVITPAGSTVERTEDIMDKIQQATVDMNSVESVSTLSGYSLISEGAGASYGMGMINLKPWDERDQSVDELVRALEERTSHIKDASIQFFPPPTVPGFGNASGFEVRLLDRTGSGDLTHTADVANQFIKTLKQRPEIADAFTNFNATFPQYLIHLDQDIAAQKGITIDNAMNNLQVLIGSYYTSNFLRFGQMYKVMVQADPFYRSSPEDILKMLVKNDKGEMVPYSAFTKLERVYGPEQLTRYNMFTAAMINGDATAGYSSGDAVNAIEEVSKTLPQGFAIEWSGMTREEVLAGNQAIYIFIICLVFVYLLLAAQYESFLLPLPVILSLPAGIFGSFLFLYLFGLQNNIYAQVALVMLIGLLGKNAILIVEVAHNHEKEEGRTFVDAALEGARARLRPILMTSFAFIAGLIPLCIASGAGAMGNRSIGTAAAGGMLIGTVFGLLVIPGLYVLFSSLSQKQKSGNVTKITEHLN
ncbi:MAG TPA: efflux RND transporter permease subunit [Cyclobacteriaceae bacterium]|jgi:HAE1 family hydrophobic/amphiphilic exporter-1|nr:efflux RND transporter permease subunit [Cytophagales bacterium]HRE65454.1 efflux RND transporter permease subunit [Cyclobacteriaceae bacterium]HRF32628.1 efflux RND transporter permease subunit [Cyclobacteriaceae bacterium]